MSAEDIFLALYGGKKLLGKYTIPLFFAMSSGMACASTIGFDPPFGDASGRANPAHSRTVVPSGYVGEVLTGYVLSIERMVPPVVALAGSVPLGLQTSTKSATQSVVGNVRALASAERGSGDPFGGSAGGSFGGSPDSPSVFVEPEPNNDGTGLPTGPQHLDFDDLKDRVNIGSYLGVDPAIIRNTSGGDIFVYHTGDYGLPEGGGFCALNRSDFSCTADISIEFSAPITDLTFSGFFAGSTDAAFLTLFDGTDMVFQGLFSGNDDDGLILFDFSWLSRITRILIEDRSIFASGGIAYGNFEFEYYRDDPVVSPVPLSASGLLLLGALALLALLEQFSRESRRRLALRVSCISAGTDRRRG